MKAEIEPTLQKQKAQQVAQKQAEDLMNQARKQGLDAAAAAMKIPVINSDFFGRKDMLPGLGPAPWPAVWQEPGIASTKPRVRAKKNVCLFGILTVSSKPRRAIS